MLLVAASIGFGSVLTLVLTKPPVFMAAVKFVMGLLSGAAHAL